MDASVKTPKSVTGFVVAGAQLVLFTTGVGNSYDSALAPTIVAPPSAARVRNARRSIPPLTRRS